MFRFIRPLLALQCFFLFHRRPLFYLGQWTKAEIVAAGIMVHSITTSADANIMGHTITNTTDTETNAGMGTTIVVMGMTRENIVLRVIETVYKMITTPAHTTHRYRLSLPSQPARALSFFEERASR